MVAEPDWLPPIRRHLAVIVRPSNGVGQPAEILAALAELDNLLARHRAALPPRLVHYLERRSYEKAWLACAKDASGQAQENHLSH
jgi:hypothetical protein